MMAWRKGFIVGWLSWLVLCGSGVWAQPQTTKQHPDYARVPNDVAQELNFPPKPQLGQEVYGFKWARIEGAAPEVWLQVGGQYTRRLRVDANKNGKLENDDPIRELNQTHYYTASTNVSMQDLGNWQPSRDPFPDNTKRLGPGQKLVPLGDFGYVSGPSATDWSGSCVAYRGPLQVAAGVRYRTFEDLWAKQTWQELDKAGIKLYKYLDDAEWADAQRKAAARCPDLAIPIVRQMLAKWDPYYREKLLPGNGFKGLYVTTAPYQLTAQDLPPQLSLKPKGEVLWLDPLNPARVLEHYCAELSCVEKPSTVRPLGWPLEQARKWYETQNAQNKHPYPVDLPGADQVTRDVHRNLWENWDSIGFRYGNVVGKVWTRPTPRSILAPGHWTNRLAQALMFKLQGGGVPRELWEEKPVDAATLAQYRMVSTYYLPVEVETTEFDWSTSKVRSTKREQDSVTLGWIEVREGGLRLPTKYVQKVDWQGRSFSFTYNWASGNRAVSGTAKGNLSGDGQRLEKLVIHEVKTQRTERDPGVWYAEKWERHLEVEGTQLVGLGEEVVETFASKVTSYACSYYEDHAPLKKLKLKLSKRTKSVSAEPGKRETGDVHITFYR
jgi:hypothetical protein